MNKTLEIYFSDLTPDAQERLLEFEGVSDQSECNYDFTPIAILEREIEIDLDEDPESQVSTTPCIMEEDEIEMARRING